MARDWGQLNENISTFGNGTRDYTDVLTFESDTDNNLVGITTTEVLECHNDSASYSQANVDFVGAITSNLYRRIIRNAPGSEHLGDPTAGNGGVVFIHTLTGGHILEFITEDHGVIEGLAFRGGGAANTSATIGCVAVAGNVDNSAYSDLIICDYVNSGAGICWPMMLNFAGASPPQVAINCAVSKFISNGNGTQMQNNGIFIDNVGTSAILYNCTVSECYVNYHRDSGVDAITRKNCISNDPVNAHSGGLFTSDTDVYEGTDTVFEDQANHILKITNAAANQTNLIDQGTDLSADGVQAFDWDFVGNTRPQGVAWDIGAHEFLAVAAGVPPWVTSPQVLGVSHV